ncbi:NlpC/P60 family protein [Ammoniphilus sp. CFH 90114]|uniref:NlpC/P60 family protein n=1 Tax=Ammoniphilus sp. CFH 90114 TaxID=2493665 RepID=UPI001F0C9695|nr:NlpC/P60 family protein [Ammoniphilus sp. CFH 90114]
MKKSKILSLLLAGGIVFSSFTPTYAATSSQIADSAQKYIGHSLKNYSAGDFIQYTLKGAGVLSSNNLSTLYKQGTPVSLSNLKKGDVAFFGSSSSNLIASGVYLGNNKIAIAYKPYGSVKLLSTNDAVVKNNFVGLRSYATTKESTNKTDTTKSTKNTQEAIIKAGLRYLGTPYEYGSSRSSTKTFDCSAFVRQVYIDAVGLDMGRGGATSQYHYLKNSGAKIKTNWRDLEKGDIMIFMPYRGTAKSNYSKDRDSIGHSGIYMGDGKVLHTYSKESGGVRVDSIAGRHWEYRFIAGGSPLKK